MPRVGIVGYRLDRRRERRAGLAPVVLARLDHVRPAVEEPLVEQRPVVVPGAGAADERLLRLLAPAHGRDAKVVPGRAVERDRDRLVAERVADRLSELLEPLGQAPASAGEPRHLDHAPKGARSVELRHSYANFRFISESYRRIRSTA